MTWTKLSDDFNDRPELAGLSRSARLLYVEALVYCNRVLNDGNLMRVQLPKVTDSTTLEADVDELTAAGLFTPTAVGFLVDFTDQEPAERVRRRKQRNAEKQDRYRERRERHAHGDHSACDARYCKQATGHVTGLLTGSPDGYVTDTRPDPSRPVPKGQGTGTGSTDFPAGADVVELPVGSHPFADDGSGESCSTCYLKEAHPLHEQAATG